MSKKCMPLWREAHFQIKMYKTHHCRTTFGSWDVEKVHAVVARSRFRSQNVQKTRFGPLLEIQMSKKCTPLWREAHVEVKMLKAQGVRTTFGGSDVAPRGRREGLCTLSKVSKSCGFCSIFNYNHHYTTLHSNTLHYTTTTATTTPSLHSTTLHSTMLHCTQLHSITLHYTTLHYTLHYITLHYTTFHYTSLHYTTLHNTTTTTTQLHSTTLNYTPLHSTTLNYTTLHYITLHSTTLNYTTLHDLPLHFTTLHYTTLHYTTTTATTTLHYTPLRSTTRNYTTLLHCVGLSTLRKLFMDLGARPASKSVLVAQLLWPRLVILCLLFFGATSLRSHR